MPQHHGMVERLIQPQCPALPAYWLAHRATAAMHRLPHKQQLQPDHHGLRQLPFEGLSGDDESESRHLEFPPNVRSVPQHDFMGKCDL
jgi:hypothetical protein